MSADDEETHFGIGAVSEDELPRGTQLLDGRYTIQALRGAGGMAMLYLARDRDRDADVALKLIGSKYARKPAAEHRLRNEGTFAHRIGEHSNIARPLEVGRLDDGRMYLVTEFVRGPSLADLLAMERRLGTVRACRVARDIAAALDAIHGHGLVHRDVKPDNIIVGIEGDREVAKLVDFGLAGEIEPVGERLTLAHERPGTRLYMAPEQLAGARTSAGFDVYALGVTMYELLCGFAPNESRGVSELLVRKLEARTSIAEQRPDLPPDLIALVDGCMHPDASRRVASAREVCERLDAVADDLAYASDPSSWPAPVPRRRPTATPTATPIEPAPRSKRRIAVALGVCAVVGLVVVAAQRWAPSVDPPAAMHSELGRRLGANAHELAVGTASIEPVIEPGIEPVIEPVTEPRPTAAPIAAPIVRVPESVAVAPSRPKIKPPTPTKPVVVEVADHDGAECVATRDGAESAAKARDWRGVLAHTTSAECWTDRTTRLRLVLRARSGLRDYTGCIVEGQASTDSVVMSMVRFCRAQERTP